MAGLVCGGVEVVFAVSLAPVYSATSWGSPFVARGGVLLGGAAWWGLGLGAGGGGGGGVGGASRERGPS